MRHAYARLHQYPASPWQLTQAILDTGTCVVLCKGVQGHPVWARRWRPVVILPCLTSMAQDQRDAVQCHRHDLGKVGCPKHPASASEHVELQVVDGPQQRGQRSVSNKCLGAQRASGMDQGTEQQGLGSSGITYEQEQWQECLRPASMAASARGAGLPVLQVCMGGKGHHLTFDPGGLAQALQFESHQG